jgi:hypothetical protein
LGSGTPLDRKFLHRTDIPAAGIEVFRFVHVSDPADSQLRADFLSDRAKGKTPLGRSARIPELLDGMSVFRSLENARRRWDQIATKVRAKDPSREILIGEFVARLRLKPGLDLMYEDLADDDGHMTLWGQPDVLLEATDEIVPAEG